MYYYNYCNRQYEKKHKNRGKCLWEGRNPASTTTHIVGKLSMGEKGESKRKGRWLTPNYFLFSKLGGKMWGEEKKETKKQPHSTQHATHTNQPTWSWMQTRMQVMMWWWMRKVRRHGTERWITIILRRTSICRVGTRVGMGQHGWIGSMSSMLCIRSRGSRWFWDTIIVWRLLGHCLLIASRG